MKIILDLFNQHSGKFDKLLDMAKQAKENGGDIVKLQLLDSKRIWGDNSRSYLELTDDECLYFNDYCKSIGIEMMITIFNTNQLKLLERLDLKRFKIASVTAALKTKDPDDDIDLINEILKKNKQTFISLGMTNNLNNKIKLTKNVEYFFCVSKYPTFLDDHELKLMPKKFGKNKINGFSDHAIGYSAALLAYFRGANFLEKHFTLNKNLQSNTEKAHLCSFSPKDLKKFTTLVNELSIIKS